MNELFTTVPVLENFDSNRQVGELRILTAALPPFPDYHFALGYRLLDIETREYTLICVSPVDDVLRKGYR